jgi:hypothetical protein
MVNKPYIATPCYKDVCPKYAASLAATAYQLGALKVPCFISEPMHNFNTPIARNLYVQMFLETDYDPLVFIDSDMGWTWEQFSRLITCGHDIAVATYPQKSDPLDDAKWVHTNWIGKTIVEVQPQPLWKSAWQFIQRRIFRMDVQLGTTRYIPIVHPRTGFVKVKASGTGFFAIRRAALEKIIAATPERACMVGEAKSHNLFEVAVVNGHTHTEDTFFCQLWNQLHSDHPDDCTCDHHIWCDPQGQLNHVGQYTWTGGLCDTLSVVETVA